MPTQAGGFRGADAFVLVGGRPSLDLVATLGRRHAEPFERIPDADALARWFVAAGITPAPPATDGRDLADTRRLREAIHALVRSVRYGHAADADAVAEVNVVAARADLPRRLTVEGPGRFGSVPLPGDAAAALAHVARDAVELLSGPQAGRIKECAHPDCSLVFLDATQAGRRRWCSMDRCGNLVKTAGYRARRGVRG